MKKHISLFLFLFSASMVWGQNNRFNTNNSIGWYNYFGTFNLSNKFGIHTEYQWRRNNFITDWQQSLLRIGINYQINPKVFVRAGYAWVETFPYGEIPINGLGKVFTEHRTFQMIQFAQKESIFDISHRWMLEQRFVGRYNDINSDREDEFVFSNRIRYMFRIQVPLKGKEVKSKAPYLAVYDEIFIGFGKNVNANVFDQNRIGVLLGYRLNDNFRIEAGYLNQILQFGRQINNQSVFQYNNGLIINAFININPSK